MSMIIHKTNLPDIDIDTSSFVYEGKYILIQDEYITNVLKCMNVHEIDADDFFLICDLGCFRDYPEVLESYALKSPNNAYYYAILVIRGRFELGENIIDTNVRHSYLYARNVLKGKLELGEKAIATNSYYSYNYARHVIKGRFELGEEIIATNSYYSYYYARDVLKGRFELGEPTILNSEYAYEYRERILCQ